MNKKQTAFFKLVGLSKPASFTCELLDNEITFRAKSNMPQDRFDELFKYCKNNWRDSKQAEVEYDSLLPDGIPVNPIVLSVKEM